MADFVSKWTVTAGDLSITLPLVSGGTYNFTVNYGDGSGDKTVTTYNDTDASHTYSSADTYTVTISGTIEGWSFDNGGDKDKIVEISQWGDLSFGATDSQFYGCSNLDITATDAPDLSNTTNFSYAFRSCSSLVTLDVSSWDISNITTLRASFFSCSSLALLDVSSWNVSNVDSLYATFYGCSVLSDLVIHNWNVSSLTTAVNFLSQANDALSSSEYNQVLMNWSDQALNNNVSIHFGDAQYDLGEPADAHDTLTDTYNWTITDGGDTGIPFCWNFTAKYKNSNKLFKMSGPGCFPKILRVPNNIDKSTSKLIDNGIEIDPDEYEIE